ncbi:MAG: two-component system response regulator [Gammaproteobacteria bacterium]|nr:two-component system response regulator [Gammaproteobacteria bacterium]
MANKPIILIVDDEPVNLSLLTQVLSENHSIRAANSGELALQAAIIEPRPDLILLDVMMPGMNGYSVLSALRKNPLTKNIPVIFVTALDDEIEEDTGFRLGAVDYITKPIRPAILLARVKTHIELKHTRDLLLNKNEFLKEEIDRRMEENQNIQNVSIRALAHLAETRDPETGDHILRTQSYVKILATQLKENPRFKNTITDNFIDLLTKSAPLHDIGKVGIPDNILLKPGKLTNKEWIVMKTHAEIGARAIEQSEKDVDHPVEFLILAKEIAHWHHERWDGKGYPDGLAGDNIPLSARLMTIADVFDALISKRIYKEAIPFEEARNIINEGRNTQFDPDVTDAFNSCFEAFIHIAEKYQSDAAS